MRVRLIRASLAMASVAAVVGGFTIRSSNNTANAPDLDYITI
jgi:hypothetical protein